MREKMDEKSRETGLNFTLLATPAEGAFRPLCAHRPKRNTAKFPALRTEIITPTRFTCRLYYPISAYEKDSQRSAVSRAHECGHISYVELDGDTCKNIDAFESIVRCMKEMGIGYGSVNHPVDRDPVCGYNGIIDEVCPRCGRREGEGVPLERLLELKKRYHDVPDYSHLIR